MTRDKLTSEEFVSIVYALGMVIGTKVTAEGLKGEDLGETLDYHKKIIDKFMGFIKFE